MLCVSVQSLAQFSSHEPAHSERQVEPIVSLELQNARLSDAVELLGTKYKINIMADAYLDDHIVPSLSVKEAPLSVTIAGIASLFRREAIITNGVIVLRHRQWYLRSQSEQEYARQFRADWKDNGIVSVDRIDPLPPSVKPVVSSNTVRQDKENRAGFPAWLPPRLIKVAAKDASLKSLLERFAACTGWEVSYDRRMATRRVTARLNQATPGQTLEAVSILLNTTQKVSLEQGKELKQLEAALASEIMDTRTELETMSDSLKPELMEMMTQEQKEAYMRGEIVEFPLETMSPEMRQRSLKYIQTALSTLKPESRERLDPDETQLHRFRLRLTPGIPNNSVIIIGVSRNGTRIGF